MAPLYQQFDAQISMRAEETVVAGDWAWEWGHLSGSTRPIHGGQATELDGKYFYVYQRQTDGSWKIARDYLQQQQVLHPDGRSNHGSVAGLSQERPPVNGQIGGTTA